jgi:hypothetical protein
MAESIDDVLQASEVIVIGNAAPGFAEAVSRLDRGQKVIDLVRLDPSPSESAAHYEGIAW